MIRWFVQPAALALAIALSLAACENGIAPEPLGMGQTTVFFSQSTGPSRHVLAREVLAGTLASTASKPLDLSAVASIDVAVTRVEALAAAEDTADERKWVALEVATPTTINLLALPTADSVGIQLARGELPAGTYNHLRIFYSEATITFKEDVELGNGPHGQAYQAGTAYPLRIPSGEQTGIKVPMASFTVAEDSGSTVTVEFDASASVKQINVTGHGLQMSPVLHGKSKERQKN